MFQRFAGCLIKDWEGYADLCCECLMVVIIIIVIIVG